MKRINCNLSFIIVTLYTAVSNCFFLSVSNPSYLFAIASMQVPNHDPLFIVGSRLPLPGIYRFAGRITQVAFFDTTLTLEQVNTVRRTFNELNGVLGECKAYLEEGTSCPVPKEASSSLCETTLGR